MQINLIADYSHGSISGSLNTDGTQGTNPAAGFQVSGVSLSLTTKDYECECVKKIPCVRITVTARRIYDMPFPVPNEDIEEATSTKVCADGSVD